MNVSSPAGQPFTVVLIAGEGFIGFRHTTSPLPTQFTIDVPADARLGTYALAALGTTPANSQVAVRITIDVERPDLPASLTARVPQVVFDRQGQQAEIALLATFADGSVLDATASSCVTYASSNPSVATVDDNGFLRVLARASRRSRRPTLSPSRAAGHSSESSSLHRRTGCPRARSISVSSRWGRPPRRT